MLNNTETYYQISTTQLELIRYSILEHATRGDENGYWILKVVYGLCVSFYYTQETEIFSAIDEYKNGHLTQVTKIIIKEIADDFK